MNTNIKAYWLGHSAFRVEIPNGKIIYIDPFLSQNPTTPESEKTISKADYILLTHGHEDHVGDTIAAAKNTGAQVVGMLELMEVLKQHELPENQAIAFNKGGTMALDGFKLRMTNANHSSSFGGVYTGEPAGLMLHFENGLTLYHMGDTNIFYDLALYKSLYPADVAFVPMGDHFTMGPEEASEAMKLLEPKYAVPIHYATFPPLTGKPEEFKRLTEALTNTKVYIPQAGEEFLSRLG